MSRSTITPLAATPDMKRTQAVTLRVGTLMLAIVLASMGAQAAELQLPKQVTAGTAFSIPTSGSGDATFYLIGPGHTAKRQVKLGTPIEVAEDEVRTAGRYIATLCSSDCASADFFVSATDPAHLSFLVHPSRVPVAANNAISAVAFVFDKFHNLVLQPVKVNFKATVKDAPAISKSLTTSTGVAWIRMASTRKEGPAQVVASIGSDSEKRVVQQVASDACHLQIRATRKGQLIEVQTDPVRDCSGNAVPDGTVVTFSKVDASGKTTVDAPIKRGVARVEMPAKGEATISVASGVALGNELRIGGTP
jgi:hypothetical protein